VSESNNSRPSKKQRELLSFIDGFIKGYGYGPSYREVMRALNYKSVSTVATHINGLITKGYLVKKDNSARSITVVSDPATIHPDVVAKPIAKSQEKWLIDKVAAQFDDYDTGPSQKKLDNLYVLVGALHVLGLEDASRSYTSRLKNLPK
jgi:SOS-response transcriptional repressor LexA